LPLFLTAAVNMPVLRATVTVKYCPTISRLSAVRYRRGDGAFPAVLAGEITVG